MCFTNQIDIEFPEEATHIVKIEGDWILKIRKYKNGRSFTEKYVLKHYIPCMIMGKDTIVFPKEECIFSELTMGEYINYITPGQQLYLTYYTRYDFKYQQNKLYDEIIKNPDAIPCTCNGLCDNCFFHNFLVENLERKYYKSSK